MDTNETVLLTVNIDARPMRLRVAKRDESQVLLAAQALNKRIDAFRRFSANEPIDRLSWAALDLAGDLVRMQKEGSPVVSSPTGEVPKELTEIEALLNGY